jgi:orotate phosphoribosyltransferase-like protein
LSRKTKVNNWSGVGQKVVEMRARGLSQIEIARELQVSKASISSDIQYLCSQAKEYFKEYGIKIKDYHTTEIY